MLQETLEFFGLRRLPTQVGIFDSEQLKSTTASLQTAINQGVGLIALLGPSGVGKTRLLDKLWQDSLAAEGPYLVVRSMAPDKGQLSLSIILSEMTKAFGLRDRKKISERFSEIENFLLNSKKRVLLIIDEAHRLKPQILDQVRSLTDHEIEEHGETRKLLTIVLAAQAKLRWMLKSGFFESTSWRIMEIWLDPLDRQTDNYINWVLKQSGADRQILSQEAQSEIKRITTTPGEIKALLWDTLQIAYSQGEDIVSAESVRTAAKFDPNNLLAKINKQGFTVQDVALLADCKKNIAEKVLRGIHQGNAESKERITASAQQLLALSASPLKSQGIEP